MRAMVLDETLALREVPIPDPTSDQLLIRVECCAVCRTDLHVVDGELPNPKVPVIPGHQIVGRDVATGMRVGVGWLGWTCGECRYCEEDRENLCDAAKFTGYTLDGGYAEYVVADARFCFPIPEEYSAAEAAPLLCAGLIGFRAWRMAAPRASRIGLFGFGSAAQILAQLARNGGRKVFAFTRDGDTAAQELAREMGAEWAGGISERQELDAAIIFAPAGELVPLALSQVRKGGAVVCAGIHMSDLPSFPYSLLWGERRLLSVANLTRQDGLDFFEFAKRTRIETRRTLYPLENANEALDSLRGGTLTGTAVLEVG